MCSGGWPLNTNTRILAKFRKKSNETCNFNLKKTVAKKKLTVLQIWVLKASVVCEQRSTNVHEKSGSTKKEKKHSIQGGGHQFVADQKVYLCSMQG